MRPAPLLLVLSLLAATAGAAAQVAGGRMLSDEEATAFRGVGRLNVAGRRFCTATLISERVIATAAHCLYRPRSGRRVALSELRFVAGQRRDEHSAVRTVVAAAVPPDFVIAESLDLRGVQADVALLRLDAAVPPEVAAAFTPGPPPPLSAEVAVVSYARGRPYVPSMGEGCRMPVAAGGVAAVACAESFGASGSPVFAGEDGARRLVAIVSAVGGLESGGAITLAVLLEPRLAELAGMLDMAGAE